MCTNFRILSNEKCAKISTNSKKRSSCKASMAFSLPPRAVRIVVTAFSNKNLRSCKECADFLEAPSDCCFDSNICANLDAFFSNFSSIKKLKL